RRTPRVARSARRAVGADRSRPATCSYTRSGALDPGDRDPRSLTRSILSDRPGRSAGRSDGAGVVVPADGGDADPGPGIGGIDHGAAADVHADVVDGARVVGEEHEVPRSQAAEADVRAGAPLGPADLGQPDPALR